MPEVSVILPTCDRPQLVRRALASVLAQTFADLEILLLDGNRRTPPVHQNAWLGGLLSDPRIRILDARATTNAAMSRNVGLAAARAPWISFLDDDDAYHVEKIAAQHALATQTGARFVLCGYEFMWPRRRRRRGLDRPRLRGDEIVTHAALHTPLIFHQRDDVVRFDERIPVGHDVVYALTFVLRHHIEEIPVVPRALVSVFPQPAGTSVRGDKEAAWRGWRAACKLARKRFSRPACRSLLVIGRLERAMSGHGSTAHFWRCAVAVLRTRGLREWRFVAYSILVRMRRR